MVTVAIPQMGSDLFRKYMKSKYSKSLETAGAVPVWIELDDIDFAVSKALKCCGLLLPGGADVNPKLYNQAPAAACGKPNEKRDFAEPKILDAFLKTGRPIFGICRGIQILNVCLGEDLIQDIKPAQKHNHSDFLHRARTTHSVKINKNSKLYSVLREDSLMVNSIHHQVVNNPGKNLIVSAKSDDGFVEGIELLNYDFCIEVQWHPEHMAAKDAKQRKLFAAFVNACEEYDG